MKKASLLDYTFGVSKIRALEKFLIKHEVFEKAIESGIEEALRLFAESDLYSDELLGVKDSQGLEMVLGRELLSIKKLVSELFVDNKLADLLEINDLAAALAAVKKFGTEFLADYIMHLIDTHNIKTFLRLRLVGSRGEDLEKNILCEGFIRKKDFLKLYNEDLQRFLIRLEYIHKRDGLIDYAAYLGEAIQKLEKDRSFIALERAINDLLLAMLKPAKYIIFGPEPLVAYYYAKVNEINLIRMIILAKLNDVSTDLVKERLNGVYA